MCDLCKSYIYDYLHLKERIHDPRLAYRQDKIKGLSLGLADELELYLRQMHPFTRDHFHRILKDAGRVGKRMYPKHETDESHRLAAEQVIVRAYVYECKDMNMANDLDYWCIVLQEAGVARSDEAVRHWLGTKLVNLLVVLQDVHECHSTKLVKECGLPLGLRAYLPNPESKEDDLYS